MNALHIGLSSTNGTYTGDATGTNVDRIAVQWMKLTTDTNGAFLSLTNGRVYDPTTTNPYNYYYPSLMVNKGGDMVMGFSGSRSNAFIGAFYTYRTAGGTIPMQPLLLKVGENPFAGSRWGDYSYHSVDPMDGVTVWTVQAYAGNHPFDNPWGTWISEILPLSPHP